MVPQAVALVYSSAGTACLKRFCGYGLLLLIDNHSISSLTIMGRSFRVKEIRTEGEKFVIFGISIRN